MEKKDIVSIYNPKTIIKTYYVPLDDTQNNQFLNLIFTGCFRNSDPTKDPSYGVTKNMESISYYVGTNGVPNFNYGFTNTDIPIVEKIVKVVRKMEPQVQREFEEMGDRTLM